MSMNNKNQDDAIVMYRTMITDCVLLLLSIAASSSSQQFILCTTSVSSVGRSIGGVKDKTLVEEERRV